MPHRVTPFADSSLHSEQVWLLASSEHIRFAASVNSAKDLSRWAERCFAALSMTGRDLAVVEELSRACELCLSLQKRDLAVILYVPVVIAQ
jgi:hypothetical protein